MSSSPATQTMRAASRRRASAAAQQRRRRSMRRRRVGLILAVAAFTGLLAVALLPRLGDAVREISLPLKHEDVIRQQSADKGLDPALVASVIYAESRFRDQTSRAGARGLMQITPQTADYIARKSGGVAFEQGDLATPQINIAYGTFYLRYLLDRYDGNEVLALAAYNGGEGNVDRWLAQASTSDEAFSVDAIPFAETRHYVQAVLEVRGDYRDRYARELGL